MIPHPPHQATAAAQRRRGRPHHARQPEWSHRARSAGNAGVTLIELLIAVVIMGVLLAVAFPSYQDSVRKGRRAEGIAALTALQHAQERFRANSPKYGHLNNAPANEKLPNADKLAVSAHARYALAVTVNAEATYTAVATAAGAQAEDSACKLMGVRSINGRLIYGSSSSSIEWGSAEPDSGRCWAK